MAYIGCTCTQWWKESKATEKNDKILYPYGNKEVEINISVGKDKTVFLSTHIMQEVYKICNRLIIINKGEIVDDQLISNFTKNNIDLEDHFRKLTTYEKLPTIWCTLSDFPIV